MCSLTRGRERGALAARLVLGCAVSGSVTRDSLPRYVALSLTLLIAACTQDFGVFAVTDDASAGPVAEASASDAVTEASRDAGVDASSDARTRLDSSSMDTGAVDTGIRDAGIPDTWIPDTGMPDTGTSDTSTQDSGTDAAADAADAGDPGIVCGAGVPCNPSTQACCIANAAAMCIQQGSGCGGFTLACDDPADCVTMGMAGAVCCASIRTDTTVRRVRCVQPANCLPGGGGGTTALLCDPNASMQCPGGQTCGPNGSGAASLNGYFTCN
jgi:hypothetical protein